MKYLPIRLGSPAGDDRRWVRTILPLCLLLLLVGGSCPAYGQQTQQDLTDPNLSDSQRQQETLDWLNKYLSDSDLLLPGAADKIRAAVAQMTPSQLQRWLEQTRKLREFVETPEWQATKQWLRSFLKVQAIYSDKELQAFRQKLFEADPDQLLAMLEQIQAKHESMTWMQQASSTMRQMDVKGRNATVARQDAANSAARTAASRDVPLFGSGATGGRAQKPDSGYRVPGPLIDSRTVARWTVWANAW